MGYGGFLPSQIGVNPVKTEQERVLGAPVSALVSEPNNDSRVEFTTSANHCKLNYFLFKVIIFPSKCIMTSILVESLHSLLEYSRQSQQNYCHCLRKTLLVIEKLVKEKAKTLARDFSDAITIADQKKELMVMSAVCSYLDNVSRTNQWMIVQMSLNIESQQRDIQSLVETVDQITYEGVDNASNYSISRLPEKVLYETNRPDRHSTKRMYKMTTRDYSSEGTIKIAACKRGDIMDDFRKEKGYFHIAAVQILVKWLGNSGIDIPLQIAIRDERLSDPKQSILGLWSSNLYSGAVYTELFTDLLFSAAEKNIDQILTIQFKPTVERLEGSKALAVSVNTYMS